MAGLALVLVHRIQTLDGKTGGCFKSPLLGCSNKSVEYSRTNTNVEYDHLVQEISEEKNIIK